MSGVVTFMNREVFKYESSKIIHEESGDEVTLYIDCTPLGFFILFNPYTRVKTNMNV